MAKTKMHRVEGRPGELLSTEEVLARAAVVCFGAHGFAATSIQDIATQAGVSKGNIYHYFSSKDEVLRLIVHRVMDDLAGAFSSIADGELEFPEQLRTFIHTMVSYVAEHPAETAIFVQERRFFSQTNFADLLARSELTVTELTALLERGQAEGHIRELVSPQAMAFGLIGMATWVYQWHVPGRTSAEQISDLYAAVILDGLCPGSPPRLKLGRKRRSSAALVSHESATTREALLRAALDLFLDKGYANTSVNVLARGAGVTTGAFYSQFASKEAILHTIMGRFLDRLCESMDAAMESGLGPPQTLARMVVAIFGEVGDHQTELTIFLQEFRVLQTPSFADLRELSSALIGRFVSVLDAGVEAGEFREMFSRRVMADGLVGLCAFPFLWMEPGEDVPDGVAEMFAEVVLAGLRPRRRRR